MEGKDSKVVDQYHYEWPTGTPVVAIDIGTSRSGAVATSVGNEEFSQCCLYPKGFESGNNGQAKVLTALLLRPKSQTEMLGTASVHTFDSPTDVDVVAFGEDAEKMYVDMPAEERADLIFCKWFKMLLHKSAADSDPVLDTDPSSRYKVTLSVVITKSIEVFRDAAMQYMDEHGNVGTQPSDLIWALTVPAIWSDRAKYRMRKAAFSAGLMKSLDGDNLILCLEPEGVCFAVLTQSVMPEPSRAVDGDEDLCDVDSVLRLEEAKDERGSDRDLEAVLSRKGNKFVVLDAGGGTVDIAAYEVVSARPFKVKQLAAPTGGPYGSTQVNDTFMTFVRDLIGPAASAELDRRRDLILDIRRAWEAVKTEATKGDKPSQINLSSLQSEILSPLGLSFNDLVKAGRPSGLAPEVRGETRLMLPATLMATFFDSSINDITSCLRDYRTSTRAGEASHLILAGGYSSSPYLWDALQVEFGASIHMLGVSRPDTAVVRGAAIYGTAHKERVTHRISAFTYGQKSHNPNDPMHRSRVAQVIKDHRGLSYLPVFVTHVAKGTEIPVGFASERVPLAPVRDSSTAIETKILASSAQEVRFPDEDGVHLLAKFDCPLHTSLPFDERAIDVEFEFGEIELRCSAFRRDGDVVVGSVRTHYP